MANTCSYGDELLGHVTSGAYGHTLGGAVGLAWVNGDVPAEGTVEIRGERIPRRSDMHRSTTRRANGSEADAS